MGRALGQSIIVDNVSGAGGTLGVAKVARAAADGYTLSIAQTTSNVFSVAVYNVPYDVLADFEPVALISSSALMMVGRADLPAANLRELIQSLKASPQPASFATVGVGSPGHVWGHQFEALTGIRVQLIPDRGAAPAMQDLVAGRIDLSGLEASSSLPYVQAGKIKAFGVLTSSRWPGAPDIPTLDEQGLPGLVMPDDGTVGQERHAGGDRAETERRGGRDDGRSGDRQAPHRSRPADTDARPADAAGAGRPAPRRHREMVADHQGGEHQGGLSAHPEFSQPVRRV